MNISYKLLAFVFCIGYSMSIQAVPACVLVDRENLSDDQILTLVPTHFPITHGINLAVGQTCLLTLNDGDGSIWKAGNIKIVHVDGRTYNITNNSSMNSIISIINKETDSLKVLTSSLITRNAYGRSILVYA